MASFKMQAAIIFFALVTLSYSAPQPRKLFHEHHEDFSLIVMEEVGDEIFGLLDQYLQFEEFQAGINYMVTADFRNLIYEMEDIPEFKAVVDFLESHDIDIHYYIDQVNEFVDSFQQRNLRIQASGRDTAAFIRDRMALFPKEKLIALYEEKMATDEGFRHAMESFDSDEWKELYSALWQNETFFNDVAILEENGYHVELLIAEYKALFGRD